MTEYDLLNEPLIPTLVGDTRRMLNLCEVFVELAASNVVGFDDLQPHQEQPWFCFLVQVAAMAVLRKNGGDFFRSEEEWRRALTELAGSSEAWCLVVEDLAKPAFFQPPVPEGNLKGFKADTDTPDSLDILIKAKNHEIKIDKIRTPSPFHWMIALITLQTLQGFLGAGNYGIARMNGGFASRGLVAVYSAIDFSTRFKEDVRTLVDERQSVLSKYDFKSDGIALLWTVPWDGGKDSSVSIWDCDPYVLEVCRRIRFSDEGGLVCYRASSKAARIDAPKELNGVFGDPWAPIDASGGMKALTLSGRGFHYSMVRSLLFEDGYTLSICANPKRLREGGYFYGVCLVRGQGKTEGFHHRVVKIPKKVVGFFKTNVDPLALASKDHIGDADVLMTKVLYPALRKLISSDGDGQVDGSKTSKWSAEVQDAIDAAFFEYLWLAADDRAAARISWRKFLVKEASRALAIAEQGVPIASARRYRAISAAESILNAGLRKHFPYLYEKKEEIA